MSYSVPGLVQFLTFNQILQPHVTDEKREATLGQVICLYSHSKKVAVLAFEPRWLQRPESSHTWFTVIIQKIKLICSMRENI